MSTGKMNLIGHKYGRLTVIAEFPSKQSARWLCQCECGKQKDVATKHLRSGGTSSCGCLAKRKIIERSTTHGMAGKGRRRSTEYAIWSGIRQRCSNPRDPLYKHYGGRGITMFKGWADSFALFLEDVGLRPGKEFSIDRIDNSKGYEPGNVRWATDTQQARNTRANRKITIGGIEKTLVEWAEVSGLPYKAVHCRLRRGWEISRALSTPLRGS